jgi:hypothetical protein
MLYDSDIPEDAGKHAEQEIRKLRAERQVLLGELYEWLMRDKDVYSDDDVHFEYVRIGDIRRAFMDFGAVLKNDEAD